MPKTIPFLVLGLLVLTPPCWSVGLGQSTSDLQQEALRQFDQFKDEAKDYLREHPPASQASQGEARAQQKEVLPKEVLQSASQQAPFSLLEFPPVEFSSVEFPQMEFQEVDSHRAADSPKLKSGAVCRAQTCTKPQTGPALERSNSAQSSVEPGAEQSVFLIFVSFSMPEASLKTYSREVQKIGGRLVVRGLIDDSFQKTQKHLLKLGIELDIDPPVFVEYQIQRVPTFISLRENGEVDRLVGHVSVEHVLEEFAESGNPFSKLALRQLKGQGS